MSVKFIPISIFFSLGILNHLIHLPPVSPLVESSHFPTLFSFFFLFLPRWLPPVLFSSSSRTKSLPNSINEIIVNLTTTDLARKFCLWLKYLTWLCPFWHQTLHLLRFGTSAQKHWIVSQLWLYRNTCQKKKSVWNIYFMMLVTLRLNQCRDLVSFCFPNFWQQS